MIVEEKIVSVNISQCATVQEIIGSVEAKEINIDVTTCFESEVEEGIFDDTFDLTFN